jgi:biopolymer transport protein ExbD
VVNVDWDGVNSVAQFSLDGIGYPTADSMEGVLASQHQKNPAATVVIRADKDVEYSNISDLMGACANAGVSTVTFAVLIGGNNNRQAPAAKPGGTASN